MQYRIQVFLFTLIFGLGGYSQNKLSGVIIDVESGEAVSDAFVIKENGLVVISDSAGQFSLVLERIPTNIVISHIAYGQSKIPIDNLPEGIMVIRIQKMISNMKEVQISAERMRILTEKDDFSLQDFAIDSTNLWMLGYINNDARNGRLWLANLYGDTLCSIPVRKSDNLYRDVFGNVHIVFEDSVYQVWGSSDSIALFAGLSKGEFQNTFNPIKGYFAGKLLYQKYLPQQEGLHTYYYSIIDSIPKFLTCIRDTTMENVQEYEYVYGHAGSVILLLQDLWDNPIKRLEVWIALMRRKENVKSMFYRGVLVPVFHTKDSLYILNLYKDSLNVYDTSGAYVASKPISFHVGRKIIKGTNYKWMEYLYDPSTDQVFCLERTNIGWILSYLDTDIGKILENVPLPDFPGMDGITVNNNAVYFLYPEKKYPFYTRLYRYQL